MTEAACQACEAAPATILDDGDDEKAPYRLCESCRRRLHAFALRPHEWYNLAKRFGWWPPLLHDDFYDEDGTATQPEETVDPVGARPAPALGEVAGDARSLFGHTLTRWSIDGELEAAWRALPPGEVLAAIEQAFDDAPNDGVRERALDVAAIAVGPAAAALMRRAWGSEAKGGLQSALFRASAACLPFDEGFGLARGELVALEGQALVEAMRGLAWFRSPATLDWIEARAQAPVKEDWGRLAAASGLDWPRARDWLLRGRPLSLVALDALFEIAEPQTPLLKSFAPMLHAPPPASELEAELSRYAKLDDVPRVRRIVGGLVARAARLCPDG